MAHTKKTIAGNVNNGTANTFSYSGSFDVFKASEVEVELDNVKLTFTTSTINESASPREYTVDYDNKTVHVGGADLASTNSVVIQPVTDMGAPTPRATYSPGSSVTSADLNNNQLQLMRKALEYDEQKLSSRGGTMTGNLHFGKNVDLSFEGDTDNAYETTITVADPTSDKTITFPDTTGTVVTTGDTATVTATMLAANSVDSSELVDGSIDTSHIADSQVTAAKLGSSAVTTVKIATDAVTGAKIADDQIDSEHYVDGSIDTAHIADSQITSAKIADGTIVAGDLASDAVTTVKITDLNVTTAKIADDAITDAKLADHASNDSNRAVDANHIKTNAVTTDKIAHANVTKIKLAGDCVDGTKLADNAVDSEHYVDGSIDTAHIADSQITEAKIATNAITENKVNDNSVSESKLMISNSGTNDYFLQKQSGNTGGLTWANVTTTTIADDAVTTAKIAGTAVTDAKLASNSVTTSKITDGNVTTDKLAADSITIGKIGCEQTTISNSDSHIPTSGAVVDYVAAQIAPIGGLEVIADEDNFPTSQPGAGVVISISDAAGIVVSGSGTSTTARTVGNGSDNVTINNFPSSLYGETLATGVGLMVSSTGSSQTYNYHKILAAETDVKQLSDDINDFNARYRVNAGEPGSNNDAGDLVFDTNANKMKVYDGSTSSWGEVTSTGEFKYLFLCPAGGSGAPTFNGSIATYDLREVSNSGTAASVTNAAQLIVSINGVVQKANTGTSAPSEGFALVDSNTIVFGANLQSGDSVFIIQIGSAVTIPTPGDGTVTTAKIVNGAVTTDKIADDAVTTAKIATNAVTNVEIANNTIQTGNIVGSAITTDRLADEAVTLAKLEHGTSSNDGKFLRANNGADPSFETVNTDLVADTSPQLGGDLDCNGNNIALDDATTISFGDNTDLQIYHSTDNIIKNAQTGKSLKILSANNNVAAVFEDNASAELYEAGSKKLETTSTGVTVTGAVTATSFSGDGSNLTGISAGGASNISFNSGNGIDFSATGDGSGSSTSELFHDYEEGTWTGAIETGTANINNEWYIKIGGYVVGGASITAISDTSSGNTVKVTGLPYSSTGGGNCPGTVAGSKISCFDKASLVQVSGTSLYFLKSSTSTGSWNYVLHSDVVQSSGSITFGFHYYCTS